jgi:hypothetical protein
LNTLFTSLIQSPSWLNSAVNSTSCKAAPGNSPSTFETEAVDALITRLRHRACTACHVAAAVNRPADLSTPC